MLVDWTAEMRISGVDPAGAAGESVVLKLALKGTVDPDALSNLAYMMRAPYVRITIEEIQPQFTVSFETGEISEERQDAAS